MFGYQKEGAGVALPGYTTDTLDMLAHQICSKHGYMLDVECIDAVYHVRLHPLAGRVPLGAPVVAISYRGPNLRSILASALVELAVLFGRQRTYEVSTREVPRWVS
jgi:hypothetical protein